MAIENYQIDVGERLEDLVGLLNNKDRNEGWKGPYIREEHLEDPWGGQYIYIKDSKGGYSVSTLGKDKRIGGKGENGDIEEQSQQAFR